MSEGRDNLPRRLTFRGEETEPGPAHNIMSVEALIHRIRSTPEIMENVTEWRVLPESSGRSDPLPPDLHPSLAAALRRRGIEHLHSHQRQAWDAIRSGRDVVIVTPTASGKTLCYNLPVIQSILESTLPPRPTNESNLAQDDTAAVTDSGWLT